MLNVELNTLLNNSPLNDYLKSNELELIRSYGKLFAFSPGKVIIHQGKKAKGIYMVLNGNVRLSAKILGEGTTHLETLEPGNFFGEISFIGKVPCATSAIADTEVQCLFLSKTYFAILADYFPETKYKLLHAISQHSCKRLQKMHAKIITTISSSPMITESLFREFMHSLTKPAEISFDACHISKNDIQQLPLFSLFKKNEIDELFQHITLLNVEKNCTLIHKNEKNQSCYIVVQGAVQSNIVHEQKTAKLSIIGPSTLFASITCIDKAFPFTINFTTCEQAILLKLSEQDLNFFQTHHPAIWYKLFNLICLSFVLLEKSVDKLDIRLSIETYNR